MSPEEGRGIAIAIMAVVSLVFLISVLAMNEFD